MPRAYMDSSDWHDRVSRLRTTPYERDRLRWAIKLCFSHLEHRFSARGYQALALLETYEAFVFLRSHTRAVEEQLWDAIIHEFRHVMADRLNGWVEPEMAVTSSTRPPDSYDLVSLFHA